MRTPPAAEKEVVATLMFSAAGVVGLLLAPRDSPALAPTALFYTVLVINTFFSIRFFAHLPPTKRDETRIDGILTILYLALALTIGRAVPFMGIATVLFLSAIAKYALLLRLIEYPRTLHRKMAIDSLGALLCLATLVGAWAGFAIESAWALAVVFAAANVFLLLVRPMYRVLDS